MAKTRLSGALLVQRGWGQVEPNHLSAQRTAQIYAQLPAKSNINVLENGQFVKYDYATGEVNFTGAGEWMLVYNEVKLYGRGAQNEDFALEREKSLDMVPRVMKTNIGDAYTTNTVNTPYANLAVNDRLLVGADGFLVKGTPVAGDMVWQVVKKNTLADRQDSVKLMRIQ